MAEEWSIIIEPDNPCQRCEKFKLALEEYFDYFSNKFDIPKENFSISVEVNKDKRKKLVYDREQSRRTPHRNTKLIEAIDEEGNSKGNISLAINIIGLKGNAIEELTREVNTLKKEFLGVGNLLFDISDETVIDSITDDLGIQRRKKRRLYSLSITGNIDFSDDDMDSIESSRIRAVEFQQDLKYAVDSLYFSRTASTVIDRSNIGIFINTDQDSYIVQVAIPYNNECLDSYEVTNLIREQMTVLSERYSGRVTELEDSDKYFHVVFKFP